MRPHLCVALGALLTACAMPQRVSVHAAPDRWSTIPPLGSLQVALLHARLSNAPIPYGELASSYLEVQTAANEFQRRDRVAEVQVKIDRANQEVGRHGTFLMYRSYNLHDYDFGQQGFALPLLRDNPFVMLAPQFSGLPKPYAVVLTNGLAFAFMPVPEATARAALARDFMRGARIDLEVEPVSADIRSIAGLGTETRVLQVRVVSVRLTAQDKPLGELQPRADATASP